MAEPFKPAEFFGRELPADGFDKIFGLAGSGGGSPPDGMAWVTDGGEYVTDGGERVFAPAGEGA